MLEQLDSRALKRTDCYAQRFMKTGTYPYSVLPAFGDCIQHDSPFVITVTERQKKTAMTQHNVVVRFENRRFSVDRSEVVVEAGDLVLWNCPEASGLPYCVVGEKEFFASNRLVNECGFSHAFGASGEYRWRDAYGGDARGVVRVRDAQCTDRSHFAAFHETLKKGTLVMIEDGRARPSSVEIITGQTVFFAVVKGPGLSITDERLLGKQKTGA